MKRFLKANLIFLILMGVFAAGALVLLVLTLLSHNMMKQYIGKTKQISSEIEALNKQTPAPSPTNIVNIKKDTEFLKGVTSELQSHFGRPYEAALTKFAAALGLTLPALRQEFKSAWAQAVNPGSVAGREHFYIKFKRDPKWAAKWNTAMDVFEEAVKPVLVEPVNSLNVDDIFQEAMGLKRDMGFKPEQCKLYMDSIRYRLIDLFAQGQVATMKDVNYFGFNFAQPPAAAEIVPTVRQWNIIGDLARRIAGSKISSLESFKFRALMPEVIGSYLYYHYTFEIIGTQESIRNLVHILNAAYLENRIYAVRSVFLYTTNDEVRTILEEYQTRELEERKRRQVFAGARNEHGADDSAVGAQSKPAARPRPEPPGGPESGGKPGRPGRPGAKRELTEQEKALKELEDRRQYLEQQAKLPYYERDGYGKKLFGGDEKDKLTFRAVFDVDYIVRTGTEAEL